MIGAIIIPHFAIEKNESIEKLRNLPKVAQRVSMKPGSVVPDRVLTTILCCLCVLFILHNPYTQASTLSTQDKKAQLQHGVGKNCLGWTDYKKVSLQSGAFLRDFQEALTAYCFHTLTLHPRSFVKVMDHRLSWKTPASSSCLSPELACIY